MTSCSDDSARESQTALGSSTGEAPALQMLQVWDIYGQALSGDGKVVVGESDGQAVRWTAAAGLQPLEPSYSTTAYSSAHATNFDGSVVAGSYELDGSQRTFRWTEEEGYLPLPLLMTYVRAVSADGAVVLGDDGLNGDALLWNSNKSEMLTIKRGEENVLPFALSADGSKVVGRLDNKAFYWTASDGLQFVPTPDGGSMATGISADGSVIAGVLYDAEGIVAFRWSDAAGYEEIGSFEPFGGCNADCSVVVGRKWPASRDHWPVDPVHNSIRGVVWTETHGERLLDDILLEAEVGLPGQGSETVTSVSDDGRVVLGSCYLSGGMCSFRAVLP